jgi:hypothetical protein
MQLILVLGLLADVEKTLDLGSTRLHALKSGANKAGEGRQSKAPYDGREQAQGGGIAEFCIGCGYREWI